MRMNEGATRVEIAIGSSTKISGSDELELSEYHGRLTVSIVRHRALTIEMLVLRGHASSLAQEIL